MSLYFFILKRELHNHNRRLRGHKSTAVVTNHVISFLADYSNFH